jgi:PAS domain S-box-containing protein
MSENLARVSTARNGNLLADDDRSPNIAMCDLFMQAPSAIGVLFGEALRWEFVNSEFLRVAGRNRAEEFVGKTIRESLPELEGQGFFEPLENVYYTGNPYVGKEVKAVLNKNGHMQEAYFNFVYQPLRSDDGRVQGVLVQGIDVTYEVLARDEINRRDRAMGLLAAIVDSSDDAIVSKNLDGVITSWNKSAELLFGYTAEEAVGRHITLIIPPDRREEEDMIIERIRHGLRVDHFETVRLRKDGSRIELSLTISPVKDSAGKIIGASKVARDISERRQAARTLRENEERLRKTEKLAAAGQLAASLAHEINNPLSSITNALYLLKHCPGLDPKAQNFVSIASTELARMSRIVKQSLSYYRSRMLPKDVDIAAAVDESLQVFSGKTDRAGIEVTRKIAQVGPVLGYPDEVRQVIDNLLLNAVEAMPRGGRLAISVHPSRSWRDPSVHGVRLTIADSGAGIPKGILPRIFEPFFTTKPEKGTGLGLWVVYALLARHEGAIRVHSSALPGRSGTAVSVLWPHAFRLQKGEVLEPSLAA